MVPWGDICVQDMEELNWKRVLSYLVNSPAAGWPWVLLENADVRT